MFQISECAFNNRINSLVNDPIASTDISKWKIC